jgi:hypothetical protein
MKGLLTLLKLKYWNRLLGEEVREIFDIPGSTRRTQKFIDKLKIIPFRRFETMIDFPDETNK